MESLNSIKANKLHKSFKSNLLEDCFMIVNQSRLVGDENYLVVFTISQPKIKIKQKYENFQNNINVKPIKWNFDIELFITVAFNLNAINYHFQLKLTNC